MQQKNPAEEPDTLSQGGAHPRGASQNVAERILILILICTRFVQSVIGAGLNQTGEHRKDTQRVFPLCVSAWLLVGFAYTRGPL